ncbi:Spy/CpxP family protein refolding chaperone [Telmatospirillum sp.]|uniref:Spy/CpxP family protein refolding chaperone n=1 Tax=Telmatospirillum sp. TaxID=2079197 RepID=UPI00284DF014|nr:Spy/CpxP family protein refolding chaperone [Telmatospirillum sp.]MDR3435659.1 Spy/CpxP family protein refolding chaperone [Telmatospirillum sp.]
MKPVVVATFLTSVLVAAPVFAAEPTTPTAAHAKTQAAVDPVEAKIGELHQKLHIVETQEPQWAQVAQVMRDNAKSHEDLVKDKQQNDKTMTAADDLNAYAAIVQDHADGAKKLAAAFETLYGMFSDDQKKAADEVFRAHKQQFMHQHPSSKHSQK